MKTTKEEIILESLRLFSERGYDGVSTSMIAEKLGITKGALYRHFENKQDIFDSIISKMYEMDEKQANDNNVPAKEYKDTPDEYRKTEFENLCEFVNEQLIFWTENEFACLFRRMITIEQFKSNEMSKLYQDVIAIGPIKYTTDLLMAMLDNGQLKKEAGEMGLWNLAMQLFAPLQLSIQLYDGGMSPDEIKENLRNITADFESRWISSYRDDK